MRAASIPLSVLLPFEPEPSPTDKIGELARELTQKEPNSTLADWLIGTPLRVALILVIGFIVLLIVRRAIRSVTEHLAAGAKTESNSRLLKVTPLVSERRAGRARTLGSVLRSTANIVIGSIIALMVLDQFDINLAPLLASAGVAGVALGFGAQSLVKDFLSGTFLLLEDQYGVGDIVDFGTVTGVVEEVALRVTKVRGWDGTLWFLRNGEIISIGNQTQGWGRALVDIRVGYTEDVDQVRSLLEQSAAQVHSDPAFSADFLAAPLVLGIEDLSENSILFQMFAKTKQGQQYGVSRALRETALKALSQAQIPLVGILRSPDSVGD